MTQGVWDTQYQQATPLDSQTDFPSVPSKGSLSGRFPETLVKKYSEKVSEDLVGAGIVAKGDKRVVAVF